MKISIVLGVWVLAACQEEALHEELNLEELSGNQITAPADDHEISNEPEPDESDQT